MELTHKGNTIKFVNADSMELLKELPDDSVDLIVTDPPYNISYLSHHRKKDSRVKFDSSWDVGFNFTEYFKECMRVLKNDSCLFVFSRFDTYAEYIQQGFPVPYSVLIWDKMDYGMGNLNWFSTSFEIILTWTKGRPKLNSLAKRPNGMIKCFKVQNMASREGMGGAEDRMLHPTQKPLGVLSYLIQYASQPGDVIFDPFAGSASTGIAALKAGRGFLGAEKNKDNFIVAEKRINDLINQKDLTSFSTLAFK